jgi:hypothetical protein
MKHLLVAFLPTFALALNACTDMQTPLGPKALSSNGAAAVGPPTTVVYSNFGQGMTFDANPFHGWGINGNLGPSVGQQAISQRFTPSSDYRFATASVALVHFSGPTRIRVILQADSMGKPGPIIEEMGLDITGSLPTIYSANSNLSPTIHNGIPYWLTVAAGASGVIAGWNWNSVGDVSSMTFASTQGGGPNGPWGVSSGVTRSAFQIEGRELPAHGVVIHAASGGGTVIWATNEKVTYGVHVQQMDDGSVKGELLFHQHDNKRQFKGTVTCLIVVGNRAYLSGDLTQVTPPFNFPHFAIGLEDNGEGSNAAAEDRISGLILLPHGWPPCYQSFPVADWTHGNAQVR